MRVFVTGASGWVGSAVTRQLVAGGHKVVGLARSDKAAEAVLAAGGEVLRGELAETAKLAEAARAADAVVHCGFIHDFSNFALSAATDASAIDALGEALAGSGKTLLVTSGLAGLSLGRPSTEDDLPNPAGHPGVAQRVSEQRGLAQVDRGVAASCVRLPPTVHGAGDHGFIAAIVAAARQRGSAGYVGDGSNRWSAVSREDAAAVYVKALEKGAGGARYHAVGETGVPFRDIAGKIGEKLGLPVVSVEREKAGEQFGWIGMFVPFDAPASSTQTQQWLDWRPTGPTLMQDLDAGSYFAL